VDVVIVRHAIAEDRDAFAWPDDSRRPLTEPGRERFAAAARGIGTLVPRVDHLLASPYVRAWETAEILAAEAGWPAPEECPELMADAPARLAVAMLERLDGCERVAVVGHEPNVTLLAHALLRPRDAEDVLWFKKGGAACVRFKGDVEPGRGRLRWLHQPKALRALAG
jgi:phosphohistidine phosphatase